MTDSELLASVSAFAEANRENIVRDIGRLVAVNSVNGAPEEGKPFGAGPAEALRVALEISSELGLGTKNCDGMIGYATIGSGKDYLSTITHVDVVPEGPGWKADPFTMRVRDGYMLGRGVMDDKGPTVLCLYTLKYLLDNKIPLRHEIRALIGVNEELGMEDIIYYLKNYPAPVFCFTPDANFPVCNGEKGICRATLVSRMPKENIVDIKAGVAANAIPGIAEAWIKCDKDVMSTKNVSVEKLDNGTVHITATGKSGHASLPAGTVNAIGVLVEYILAGSLAGENEARFLEYIMKLHSDYTGAALGIAADDGKFDPLTIVGGIIGFNEEGRMYQTVDSRYPTNTNGELIKAGLEAAAEGCADVELDRAVVPFYIDSDSDAVKICINTYNEITGESKKPFTIGGGTYARDFPYAVSFGPEHDDRPMPEWCGTMHGAEEAANIDDFIEALKIYIIAMIRLDEKL